jgi:hypothetical protein
MQEHGAPAGRWAHSDHLPVVADFDEGGASL